MVKFLRPKTLFEANKFQGYYGQRNLPAAGGQTQGDSSGRAAVGAINGRLGVIRRKLAELGDYGPHFSEQEKNVRASLLKDEKDLDSMLREMLNPKRPVS